MAMSLTPTRPTAALVADAIARIEERRDALDRLADRGVEMVERLAAGETVQIAGRKPFADQARAYAVISRAVRFCLALASRLDQELIALLRGGPIPNLAILAPDAPAVSKATVTDTAPEPRARIARVVDAAIEVETADREDAEVGENLVESENYDALLHRPWPVVIGALRADLGLDPDWDESDGGEGFNATPMPQTLQVLSSSDATGPPGVLPSPLAGEGGGAADG